MQCFIDGKCKACGGQTHSHDTEGPMRCGWCGAEYPVSEELKKLLEEAFDGEDGL